MATTLRRCLLFAILGALSSGSSPENAGFIPFDKGEKITFSLRYGPLRAGTATLEVKSVTDTQGRERYHIISLEKTNSFFSAFYRVDDRYESLVDKGNLSSVRYEKHIREGSYQADQIVEFDRQKGVARYDDGEEVEILPGAKDIFASIYYIRTLKLEVGDSLLVNNHTDGKNYPLQVEILKREEIDTPAGHFKCIVVRPKIEGSKVFASREGLTIWLTDDLWKVPVLIRSKIFVGSISAVAEKIEFGS